LPSLRLTKRSVEEIPFAEQGQQIYRDTSLQGFALRVGAKQKSYIAEGQVNGRTRRYTIGRADLFAADAARKRAVVVLGEMADGRDPNERKRLARAEQISLETAFEQFFEARPNLSPHTVSAYQRTLRLYLNACRKKPLSEITRQIVLQLHRDIACAHGETTANNAMRHLRSVYNFISASHDGLPPNPVQILNQARAWYRERRRQTIVSAADLPSWWTAVMAEPEHSRDYLIMAILTGMRRGELSKPRWADLDLQSGTLHLQVTKSGHPLDLPLSAFLIEILKERKRRSVGSPWVFPGTGKSGHLIETKKFLSRVSAGSGVTFTLHDLRRTYITIAESLDVPHYALKRLLNHSISGDVTGGYIVIDVERLREPVERISARILELAAAL